jgi:Uri superfamily endonuclease
MHALECEHVGGSGAVSREAASNLPAELHLSLEAPNVTISVKGVLTALSPESTRLRGSREVFGRCRDVISEPGPHPGTYALVCRSSCAAEIAVGRLGVLPVRRGFYVYVGSAFGPGGLRARVGRHVKRSPNRHWHVDYLWPVLRIREIWYAHERVRREHEWARILRHAMGGSLPLPRFGASDCRCESHLAFFAKAPSFDAFRTHVHAIRIRI